MNVAETQRPHNSYPSGSWGLGVVIPEGAEFENGEPLFWEHVKNITAVARLPNIDHTDDTIYTILSVMTGDGPVLQVAAGIYANETAWYSYAFIIKDLQAQSYVWILNASKPEMKAGTWIALSIYQFSDHWNYSVENLDTNQRIHGAYSLNVLPFLRKGDQEVFAFESYSSSRNVFQHMGNLSLSSLLIDGHHVTKGWYYFGDWDGVHNPLFAVGGGLGPPTFISVTKVDDTIQWSFTEWKGTEQSTSENLLPVTLIVIALVIGITAAAVILEARTIRRDHSRTEEQKGTASVQPP